MCSNDPLIAHILSHLISKYTYSVIYILYSDLFNLSKSVNQTYRLLPDDQSDYHISYLSTYHIYIYIYIWSIHHNYLMITIDQIIIMDRSHIYIYDNIQTSRDHPSTPWRGPRAPWRSASSGPALFQTWRDVGRINFCCAEYHGTSPIITLYLCTIEI